MATVARRASNLLLIAAREPTAGATKTRLGATIGMERAALLYRAFLADLAVRFTPGPGVERSYDLGWAFTPAECDFRAVIAALGAATARSLFIRQVGSTWAERQTNLLRWGHHHGYDRTVLIASDSPQLPRSIPEDAIAELADHDVALGRVHDGGYYLIGVRGFHDVLTGVPMSTPSAAGDVCARVHALGLRLAELPPSFDVDVAADLDLLRTALEPDGRIAPATWITLRDLDLPEWPHSRPSREANADEDAGGASEREGQQGFSPTC